MTEHKRAVLEAELVSNRENCKVLEGRIDELQKMQENSANKSAEELKKAKQETRNLQAQLLLASKLDETKDGLAALLKEEQESHRRDIESHNTKQKELEQLIAAEDEELQLLRANLSQAKKDIEKQN